MLLGEVRCDVIGCMGIRVCCQGVLSECAKVRYCRMRVRWAFQVVLISICVKGVVLD